MVQQARQRRLQHLFLNDTRVTDLTPLAGLKELEVLLISNTQVSDLSPLAGLKNLRTLQLHGTLASDEQVQQLQRHLPVHRH